MTRTFGSVMGRTLGVFGVIGLSLGIGAIFFLATTGVLAEGGVGGALAAGFLLLGVLVFAALVGVVVAALMGWYAGSALSKRRDAIIAGAVGGAAGHAVMVVALVLVLVAGIAMMFPNGTGSSSSTGATAIDLTAIGKLILGVLPAGLVGGVTASLLHVPAPSLPVPEVARPTAAGVLTRRPEG